MKITAHEFRTFAQDNGQPVGKRGRLSVDTIAFYLAAHPAQARAAAHAYGVPIGARGRISQATIQQIAEVVA